MSMPENIVGNRVVSIPISRLAEVTLLARFASFAQ